MKNGDRSKVRELILQAIRDWKKLNTDVPLTSYIAEWLLQNDLAFAVRCKNCMYLNPDENLCPGTGVCYFVDMPRSFNDYCSYGERKDNNEG